MSISKILDNGVLVIPEDVRDEFQLSQGDEVEIIVSAQGIWVRPLKTPSLTEQYRGIVKGNLTDEELDDLYAES
jgi:AbrB family looped-hinge helix DNA binding protein